MSAPASLTQSLSLSAVLLVMAGGALGSGLRFIAHSFVTRFTGAAFPVATISINIVGSFLMGLMVAVLTARHAPNNGDMMLSLFLLVGVFGGFTTFSTFSMDVVRLLERGALIEAFAYIFLSVGLSVLACFVGILMGRATL